MNIFDGYKMSDPDSWEYEYWQARLKRNYFEHFGWRSNTPIRCRALDVAHFDMHKLGWWRRYDGRWIWIDPQEEASK